MLTGPTYLERIFLLKGHPYLRNKRIKEVSLDALSKATRKIDLWKVQVELIICLDKVKTIVFEFRKSSVLSLG